MMYVNRHYIRVLLEPLGGLADVDDEVDRYASLDTNDEVAVRQVIRTVLVPYFERIDQESTERIRLALAYGLSDDATRFDRIFNSNLPPFDPPSDPRDFFLWLWDECFPGESWSVEIGEYDLKDDVEEPTFSVKVAPASKGRP